MGCLSGEEFLLTNRVINTIVLDFTQRFYLPNSLGGRFSQELILLFSSQVIPSSASIMRRHSSGGANVYRLTDRTIREKAIIICSIPTPKIISLSIICDMIVFDWNTPVVNVSINLYCIV